MESFVQGLSSHLDAARYAIEKIREGGALTAEDLESLIAAIQASMTTIRNDLKSLRSDSLEEPFSNTAFWTDLVDQLPLIAFLEAIEKSNLGLYRAMRLVGLIEEEEVSTFDDPSHRLTFLKRTLRWGDLPDLVSDPAAYLLGVYRWGTYQRSDSPSGPFRGAELINEIARVVSEMGGLPREFDASDLATAAGIDQNSITTVGACISLISAFYPDLGAFVEIGPGITTFSDPQGSADGIVFSIIARGGATGSFALTGDLDLTVSGGASNAASGLLLMPNTEPRFVGSATGNAVLTLKVKPTEPLVVIGQSSGSRIEISQADFSFAVTSEESTVTCEVSGVATVVIDIGGADAFLREVISSDSIRFECAIGLQWSSEAGFGQLTGNGIWLSVPLNFALGGLEITSIDVVLTTSDGDVAIEVTVGGGLALQVVSVSFDSLGFSLRLEQGTDQDSVSLAGLVTALDFVTPTGLGLAIDTGVVSGGGYLSFDAGEQTYAGIVELGFLNLDLQAYGLITTSLPDGSEGWSMVIFISTSFAPIPIGFGFFLEAVGGMFGYNRSVDADVLQAGIREGTLDSLLFPDDPVANAVEILSDLEAVFPATEGQYLFGPMAEIGWPSPSILDVDLAIILEAPDPARVLVLGQIAAQIPSQEPIIELHVDVVGVLDLDQGTLSIDASLYDSSVALYSLNGQMALRMGWGSKPEFALAVGGFNPRYDPPDDIGTLERVSISLDTDNPRISLEGYFALTSNTVQFGADMDLYASAVGFTVEGNAGFDVLIVFSPFGFETDIAFAVVIRAGSITLAGVDLELDVTGPKPWEIDGSATFKLLLLEKSFSVHLTLGQGEAPASPEPIDVAGMLEAAIGDSSNWTSVMEDDAEAGVTFAARYDDVVLVHPAGGVEFRQSSVPLNVQLDFYSGQPIEGSTSFALGLKTLGGDEVTSEDWSTVEDWFAPGLYFEMSDQETLEGPDYELMTAGIGIGTARVEPSGGPDLGVVTEFGYESFIVHSDTPSTAMGEMALSADELQHFCASSATASARASGVGSSRFQGTKKALRVVDTPWVVAGTNDLVMASAGEISAGTRTTRYEALRAINAEVDASELQVVPSCEATDNVP